LPDLRFCPRCGLSGVAAAGDSSPLEVLVHGRSYRVLDRIAVGSVCSVYRCMFAADAPGAATASNGLAQVEGVFKIARDARNNALVSNEAAVLRELLAADPTGRFTRFMPKVQASVGFCDDPRSQPRQANVLRVHESIRSPDELYSLADVRGAYPAGLDARHVAWIWRRLLSVLGFAHTHNIVHAAVLPMHVLIEPAGHKLVLVDWCCAARVSDRRPVTVISAGHSGWYGRSALRQPPTPTLDVALGVRCMIYLLGGEAVRAEFPPGTEPALARYFRRCLGMVSDGPLESPSPIACDAWKLLEDFDKLIEALWGPRQFQVLTMPPRLARSGG
jgi:hypothetical protein